MKHMHPSTGGCFFYAIDFPLYLYPRYNVDEWLYKHKGLSYYYISINMIEA